MTHDNVRHLYPDRTYDAPAPKRRASTWPLAPGSIAEAFRRWEEEDAENPRHAAHDNERPQGGGLHNV